jgi:hypothetical protein
MKRGGIRRVVMVGQMIGFRNGANIGSKDTVVIKRKLDYISDDL